MIDAPPDATPVQELVITGARLPPSPGDRAFSILRLDGADLARSPRLDEVLSQAPGVSLFRRTSSQGGNPTTQGLSLRAIAPSGAGRALVTLDGVPQNDPFGGWVIWSALPSQGVAAVDIVRGAGAQAYGAGALTGVVGLTGVDATDRVLRIEADAGGLSYGRGAVALGAGGLLLTATAERSDGWIPVRAGRGAADGPLALDAWSAALKYDGSVGGTAVAVRVSTYDENRQAGLFGADSRARGVQASLTLARAPSADSHGWRLQGWVSTSDLENRSVATATGRTGTTLANDQFETPATGLGFNAALRARRGPFEGEVGADVRSAKGESRERFRYMAGRFTRVRLAGGQTLTSGLYADGSWTEGDWLLTGGLRADLWSASDAQRVERDAQTGATTLDSRPEGRSLVIPTARIGLRRELGQVWFGRAAGYAGFRPPSLNELHRPFRVGNDITEANARLKPERLQGIELGLGRKAGATRMGATLFANRLEDPVANVTVGAGPATFPIAGFVPANGVLRRRQNVGAIDAVGLEMDAQHRVGQDLTLRAALSATRARVDGEDAAPQLTGKRPVQAPRLTVTASADWRVSPRLFLAADVRYESARFDDDLNSRVLKRATTLDVQARYAITDALAARVSLRNALDAAVATGRTGDGILSYDAPRTLRIGVAYAR